MIELPPLRILPAAPAAAAAPAPAPTGWPLLRLGFRPFYLGAAGFSALAIALWVAIYLGAVQLALPVPPLLWHVHEMLFGFVAAVIVGFLLTAGRAWTGLATPRGAALGALALLWLAARVAAVTGPYPLYMLLDLPLLPLVAAILVRLLLRARNRRNLPLAGMLGALALANLMFHLTVSGLVDGSPLSALQAALALVVLIECLMAGRVIPAFTMGATPGLRLQVPAWLDTGTVVVTGVALLAWSLLPDNGLTAVPTTVLLATACLANLARQAHWQPWVTRTRPILWVLQLAYLWIAVGLGLLALARLGVIGASPGEHALAVGATGGLIIGMITRTARGHTGRPIQASLPEVIAYALVFGAALVRVGVPLLAPAWLVPALVIAAVMWSGALLVYLSLYGRWLTQTRLDGRDG